MDFSNRVENPQIPIGLQDEKENSLSTSPNEIKNEEISINNIDEDNTPPCSPWHFIFSSHIPIWKFDEQSFIRINFTREKPSPYYFCHISLTLAYIYYYMYLSNKVCPKDIHHQNIVFITITFFFIMTHLSYLVTHFTNPGILPYYWSNTRQRFYSDDELRDGFAINHEQKKWGKTHDWPSRSFFAGDYGAIILRADHYCYWINHWIGLRNNKFYIQSMFYCLCFIFNLLYAMCKVFKNSEDGKIRKNFFFIFLFLLLCYFIYVHIFNFIGSLRRICINLTTIEMLALKSNFHDRGIIRNLEEVFGSIYLFPLWFFPISIPLPNDGFNYPMRPNDYCLAINRNKGEDSSE